jgi:hypothetical protein
MTKVQNLRLEHLNLCVLKIVSDFRFRASNFDKKWLISDYFLT